MPTEATMISRVPTRESSPEPRPPLQPYLVERGNDVCVICAPDVVTLRAVVRDRAQLIGIAGSPRITPVLMMLIGGEP